MNKIVCFLVFIVLHLSSFTTKAQSSKKDNCHWLKKALELDIFDKQFFIKDEEYKNDKLIIVDTCKLFSSCEALKVFNRDTEILREWAIKNSSRLGNNVAYKQYILVDIVYKTKKILTVNFWRPYNGANVIIEVKKSRIKVKSYGAY